MNPLLNPLYRKRALMRRTMAELSDWHPDYMRRIPCMGCGVYKVRAEVVTRFKRYGHWVIRFKRCKECTKEARRKYRKGKPT